jgi:putative spermidine/putrescine transport system permease protein
MTTTSIEVDEAASQRDPGELVSPGSRLSSKRSWGHGLGVVPFVAYIGLFLVVPALSVIVNAFRGSGGQFTTANLSAAVHGVYFSSFVASLKLSLYSSVVATVLGVAGALAISSSKNRILRSIVASGSAVFANTGGVPLAFSFIATLGNFGLVTRWLQDVGFDPYRHGFSLYSVLGLTIVYQYFLIPLMILIMLPAIEGIKAEWIEASSTLGARRLVFWRWVGIPLLAPAIAAAFIVMFTDAFAAYATAQALTSGVIPLVPIELGALISGNVLAGQTNLGDALGAGMILVVVIAGALYVYVGSKTSKWLR